MAPAGRLKSIFRRVLRLAVADAGLAVKRRKCTKFLVALVCVAVTSLCVLGWMMWSVGHGAGLSVERDIELIGAPRNFAEAAVKAMAVVAAETNPRPVFRVIVLCVDPKVRLPNLLRALQSGLDLIVDHEKGPTALDVWEVAGSPCIRDALKLEPWLLGPAETHVARPHTSSPELWAQSWNIGADENFDRAMILENTAVITPRLLNFMKIGFSSYPTVPFLAGFSLTEKAPPNYKNPTDPFLYTGPLETKAFAALSSETWRAFQLWMVDHRHEIGFWPFAKGLHKRDDPKWDHFRGSKHAHWSLWFTRFCDETQLQVLFPGESLALYLPTSISDVPLVDFDGLQKHRTSFLQADTLQRIIDFSRKNNNWVSVTVVTEAFVETALSWLCNVDTLGIRPPAIVWLCTDDKAFQGLGSIAGTEAFLLDEFASRHGQRGVAYGSKEYWGLMLERTYLIGDLLEQKIHVFAFETDQVWFASPMPYLRQSQAVESAIDVVGAMDSRREIGGNLLLLNPTLQTRRLWRKVVDLFRQSYSDGASNKIEGVGFIANDQSLLTTLILYDMEFKAANPIRYESLPIDLFADGLWFHENPPGSAGVKSELPVIVNNNFIRGVLGKTKRLRRYGMWFRDGTPCDSARVHAMVKGVTFAQPGAPAVLHDFVDGIKGIHVKADERTKKFYSGNTAPSNKTALLGKMKKSSKSGKSGRSGSER